jgi:ketosteroid isomerase-like protein
MSLENVEIMRQLGQSAENDGLETALSLFEEACAEDVEWIEDPAWPGSGTYRGRAGVRAVIEDRTESVDFDQQTERLIDAGDDVVAFLRWRARGRSSGAQGDMRVATVTTFKGGMIIRVRFFLDRAEALKVVGLEDQA